MTVVCIECERYTFQDRDMAKHGFGRCRLKGVGEFQSPEFERECQRFIVSTPEKAAEGRAYLAKVNFSRGETYGNRK